MSLDHLEPILEAKINELTSHSALKGEERVVTSILPPRNGFGPRYLLKDHGDKPFLRMNSNSYLGMALRAEVIRAEEQKVGEFGTGPGAVRFISGTFSPHVELEKRLAAFHAREAAMLFSSAYSAMLGTLPQLITEETLVLSDELNHNCIINALRLAKPKEKAVYPHLNMKELERLLKESAGKFKRALVVTDGIFSMRGDHVLLQEMNEICQKYESGYSEGIITVVDDSHGVGAFGKAGRGTEEYTGGQADLLIATLGKALGVNGGYVVSSRKVIRYLRETAPTYIYSNPITPGEAAAALKALEILDSAEGSLLLKRLGNLAAKLRKGLIQLKLETLLGDHPIVPLLLRDSQKTAKLVQSLFDNAILATGIKFPVVPLGQEEIRFQVNADHTEKDIDYLLAVLARSIAA